MTKESNSGKEKEKRKTVKTEKIKKAWKKYDKIKMTLNERKGGKVEK